MYKTWRETRLCHPPILFNLYSEYMMKDMVENMPGIKINGHNVNNLRYADDAVFIADGEEKWQLMMTTELNEIIGL